MAYSQGVYNVKDAAGVVSPVDAAIVANTSTTEASAANNTAARQIMAIGDPSTATGVAAVNSNQQLLVSSTRTSVTDTTAAIANGANFTASWSDASLDGAQWLAITLFVSVSGSGQLYLDQSNDTSNTNNTVTWRLTSFLNSGAPYFYVVPVWLRYYRLRIVNGSGGSLTPTLTHSIGQGPIPPAASSAFISTGFDGFLLPSGAAPVYQTGGPWAVQAPSITKGTQGATGLTVQDLKDSGRTRVAFHCTGIASVVSETVLTCSKNVGGTETTGVTTYTVTAGKTLRIQSLRFSIRFATPSGTVTFANATLRLREASVTGAQVIVQSMENPSNLDNQAEIRDFPDGLEFPAGTVLNFTQVASATTLLIDAGFIGYEY